jgi:hypothetical protein
MILDSRFWFGTMQERIEEYGNGSEINGITSELPFLSIMCVDSIICSFSRNLYDNFSCKYEFEKGKEGEIISQNLSHPTPTLQVINT